MSSRYLNDERCIDLLIQHATAGLDAAERAELDVLLARYGQSEPAAFEAAATAVTLAARLDAEPLPAALRARLIAAGESALAAPAPVASVGAARAARGAAAPRSRSGAAGWWTAAAAVLIAIGGWYPRLVHPPAAPSTAEQRERLLAAGPQVVRSTFAATADPLASGAAGDVVFDPVTQQGFMRLRLQANDPRQREYQLWIFDGERDDRYPVDGGVFDVPAGSAEVIVPITVRVRVGKPVLFAVTVERPGGVVVSAREHIVVLAKSTGA
jgi:anti-sigma-K factor RskA